MDYSGIVAAIKKQIKNNKALVFVSGGVDSAVTAALAKEALGKNAVYYFIENGLQRKGESKRIRAIFRNIGIDVIIFNAREEFLQKLSGCITGPEKRDLLGNLLMEKAIQIAETEKARHLVFGTIKNDLMVCREDVDNIPGFELVEPLRGFTKDQAIKIAKCLRLPEELWTKQHFPGVGFAVRIDGKVTKGKLALVRNLTELVEATIREMGLDKTLWGYFPFLLSKGVNGKRAIALRLVESELGLMAEIPEINKRQLIELRDRIFRAKPEIERVYLDLTPKPIALIEWM